MKKYLATLLIGFVAFALAGEPQECLAAFDSAHLIRVVYDTQGNVEVGTDLGDISTWTAPGNTPTNLTVGGGTAAFSLGMFSSGSWDKLRIGYFAVDTGSVNVWTSGPLDGTQKSINRQYGTIMSAFSFLSGYYKTLDGSTGSVVADKTYANSYWSVMDGSGVKTNSFNGFLSTLNGEVSLAALATTGYVDQTLFFYDTPNTASNGVPMVTIRTMADGSTVINASAVPIPPSVFLLGSGILGLIGFRSRSGNPLAG